MSPSNTGPASKPKYEIPLTVLTAVVESIDFMFPLAAITIADTGPNANPVIEKPINAIIRATK